MIKPKKPKQLYERCGTQFQDEGEDCGECDEGLYCDPTPTPAPGNCGMCKKKRGAVLKKGN